MDIFYTSDAIWDYLYLHELLPGWHLDFDLTEIASFQVKNNENSDFTY